MADADDTFVIHARMANGAAGTLQQTAASWTTAPVGVTLVGPRLMDSRLLAIAAACAPIIDRDAQVRKQRLWPA